MSPPPPSPHPKTYRLVEVMPHRVSQRPDGIVEDEQILVLVFPKGKHQRVQDEAEIWDQLGARLLLQGGEGTGIWGGGRQRQGPQKAEMTP